MKTIEEKARAYDEVLKQIKECTPDENGFITIYPQEIFPELKEPEDEKVRKEIIDFLKLPHPQFVGKRDHEKWIAWLEKQGEPTDKGEISDGYHTFNELYYYRMLYNAAFFNMLPKEWVHKSKKHHDGEECFGGGWFIVMANLPTGQISNHYELKDWDLFRIPEKEVADKWDGHTPQEAADRLYKYLLEKQAGQNQTDKVEPKFKVGDWIINPRTGLIKHIKNVLLCDNNGNYEFESSSMSIDSVDNSFHLWTIQDAKDGDVLYINNTVSESIMIYKSFNNGLIKKYASYNKFGFEGEHYLTLNDGYITPATKEQCTELFLKMHEAGYEWDSEKKELKKIEDEHQLKEGKFYECIKSYHYLGGGKYWFDEGKVYFCEKDGYLRSDPNNLIKVYDCENWQSYFRPYTKKTAEWSEEDEQHIDSLLKRLDSLCRNKFERTRFAISEDIDWLKSLRPQKCLIPSEEEIEKAAQEWDSKANFNPFYMTTENGKPTGVKQSITTHKESFKVGVNWILKFLKDRLQLKQEWSDVDKDILSRIIDDLKFLRDTVSIDPKYAVSIIDMEREITWLESLRPQNKWKPSDEQISQLQTVIDTYGNKGIYDPILIELLFQLKKLKEE